MIDPQSRASITAFAIIPLVTMQALCGDPGQGVAVSVGPIWHACIAKRSTKHRPLQKKGKKKMNKNTNLFIYMVFTFRSPSLTFSFLKYHPFVAERVSILSTHFFFWWFQTFPWECAQRSSGFPGSLEHPFWSTDSTVHVSTMETTRICKATFNRAIVSTFDLFNSVRNIKQKSISISISKLVISYQYQYQTKNFIFSHFYVLGKVYILTTLARDAW